MLEEPQGSNSSKGLSRASLASSLHSLCLWARPLSTPTCYLAALMVCPRR